MKSRGSSSDDLALIQENGDPLWALRRERAAARVREILGAPAPEYVTREQARELDRIADGFVAALPA